MSAAVGNTRWRFFALLFGFSFLSYAMRQNMQVAGEQIMPEYGLTEMQLGWIYGAFAWGYALLQLPGGILGERLGVRRIMTIMVSLWVLTSALTALLPGLFASSATGVLVALVVVRFATGVVHSPVFPMQAAAIEAWFPPGRWGLPNALSSTGLTLGAAATQPLVAWVMIEYGWRATFLMFVPAGILLWGLWLRFAVDDPADHPGVGAAELALIKQGRDAIESVPASPGVWKALFRNRETLLLALSYFSMYYVFFLFFNWLFHYLVKVRGFSLMETSFLAALPWVTGAITAAIGGWVCDALTQRLGPRLGCRLPAICGQFATAVFLAAGIFAPDPYTAVILLTLCFGANQFAEAPYWQAQTYVAGRHTAPATGIMNTASAFASPLVAPLIPFLANEFSWVVALSTGVGFSLLSGVLWFFIRADRPMLAPEH